MIFLSVDLDYFYCMDDGCDGCMDGAGGEVATFWERVFAQGTPPVYVHHQEMLPDINARPREGLYNVDWHDDACDRLEEAPTDADWPQYVEWRARAVYTWVRPWPRPRLSGPSWCCTRKDGTCFPWHLRTNAERGRVLGWAAARQRIGLMKIPWSQVDGVAVCVSPVYGWPGAHRRSTLQRLLKGATPEAAAYLERVDNSLALCYHV